MWEGEKFEEINSLENIFSHPWGGGGGDKTSQICGRRRKIIKQREQNIITLPPSLEGKTRGRGRNEIVCI